MKALTVFHSTLTSNNICALLRTVSQLYVFSGVQSFHCNIWVYESGFEGASAFTAIRTCIQFKPKRPLHHWAYK